MKKSLGLIETQGLAAGIEAADAAVKSANVRLIGYELTKGGGWTTIKVEGDVGAVKAAVDAARMAAAKVNQVVSTRVIPRPSAGLDLLVHNPNTVGDAQPAKGPDMPDPPTPPKGAKQVKEEQTAGQEEGKQHGQGQAGSTGEKEKAPEPEPPAGTVEEPKPEGKEPPAEEPEDAKPEGKESPAGNPEEPKPEGKEPPAEDLKGKGSTEPKAGADGEGLKPGPDAESAQRKPEGAGPSEDAQAAGAPEAEEEESPPQEAPVVIPKPAKRAAAQKGRKGAKRSNKQENTEKE